MNFPENYDGMGAKEISEQVQRRVDIFVTKLKMFGIEHKCIAPGPNGEMSVEFDLETGHREYIFYPDKTRVVIFPTDGSKPIQIDIEIK